MLHTAAQQSWPFLPSATVVLLFERLPLSIAGSNVWKSLRSVLILVTRGKFFI